jgi:hypothetical protein
MTGRNQLQGSRAAVFFYQEHIGAANPWLNEESFYPIPSPSPNRIESCCSPSTRISKDLMSNLIREMKRVKKGGTHRGKEEKKEEEETDRNKKKNEGKEKNFFFLFSQIIFGAAGGPIFNPSPKYKVRHDGSFKKKKNFFRGQLLKEKKRPKLKSKIFGTKPKRRK